VKMII